MLIGQNPSLLMANLPIVHLACQKVIVDMDGLNKLKIHDKVCNWKLKRSARFQRLFNKNLEVANTYETILEEAFLVIARADDYRAKT